MHPCSDSVSVSVSVSVAVAEAVAVAVSNGRCEKGRASAHYVPVKALCPVAERIVAAMYLASALLTSWRHSCSGR